MRGLTARERDAFESSVMRPGKDGKQTVNTKDLRARLAVLGVCDESGAQIFQREDIEALSAKSALALERVFDAVRALSGMTDQDLAELEGNSDGQSDDSPSD